MASAFAALASLIVRARTRPARRASRSRWLGAVGRVGGVLFALTLVAGFVDWGPRDRVRGGRGRRVDGAPRRDDRRRRSGRRRRRDLPLPALRPRSRGTKTVQYGVLVAAVRRRAALVIVGRGADSARSAWAAQRPAAGARARRRAWRRRSCGCVRGRPASPTGSSTAGRATPTRCSRSSPIASARPTRPTTCCRAWQPCSARAPARLGDVWLRAGRRLRPEATWPAARESASRSSRRRAEHASRSRHRGELLGALSRRDGPGRSDGPRRRNGSSRDLAAQAGLVLRNVRLIEELRASRQRLVAAQDEERRKLERNIHDGVQQQLVALNVQLGLLSSMVSRDPARRSRDGDRRCRRGRRRPSRICATSPAASTHRCSPTRGSTRRSSRRRGRRRCRRRSRPATSAGIRRTSRPPSTSACWRR